ncbi:MAG: ComEC/Rec2 family competence protein [Clostridia bacterium]|jgi:competence protein ComEC
MRIKKSFILLLTLYSIGGVLLSTNNTPVVTFLFLLLILNTCFIFHKETTVSAKTKIIIVLIYSIICIFFFIYSKLVFRNICNNYSDVNRNRIEINGYISEISRNDENEFKFVLKSNNGYKYNIVTKKSNMLIGDILCITGKIYKPEPISNKGAFDYLRYCYSKNISADIYADNEDIVKISTNHTYEFIGKIRRFALNRVMGNLNDNNKAIAAALITGSYEYMDEKTTEIFRKSGLSHILSISGTHFSILILPLYTIITVLTNNKRISIILIIVIILVLLVFTGMKISAIRSAICMISFLLCRCFFLDTNKYLPICISILVLMFINPLTIFDTGFIMSYGCVISIQVFQKRSKQLLLTALKKINDLLYEKILNNNIKLEDYYRRIKKSFVTKIFKKSISYISLIVSIQPLIIYITYKLFQCIYPYSLISNIITFAIISPMLISLWLGIIFPFLFCPIFSLLYDLLSKTALLFSSFHYSQLYLRYVPDIIFIIIAVIYIFKKVGIFKNKNKIPLLYLSASILCILIFILNSVTKAVFLDVGQGDCALVKTFTGYSILIDTGKSVESSCIAYYTGNHINTVMITHADSDHCGAIFKILEDFNVDKVCLPYSEDEKNVNLYNEIKSAYPNIKVEMLKRGDVIEDRKFHIKILNPDKKIKYKDINEASLVFSLQTNSCNLLFTGDTDLKIISKDSYLLSDIIKMPHHGDSNVIDEETLRYISSHTGIISVGKYNYYGHPEKETLDIMKKLKMNILRTDINGSIRIYMLNDKYYIFKYR